MKHIFNILLLVVLFCSKGYSQVSNTKSYQVSIDFKVPTTSNTQKIPAESVANTNVVYFDGLGRPIQQNSIKASGTGKDILKHIEYNLNGDLTQEFLPVPTSQNNGAYLDNVKDLTTTFYNTPEYDYTLNPYAEKVLEKSPERKVLAQGFPGNDWNPTQPNNHAIKFDYKSNTVADAVIKFNVSTTYNSSLKLYVPSISVNGTYAANELYKSILKDENWVSGLNNTTEEFKNKLGQLVLKRNYNNGNTHDTYYAYDIYGNLSYVIPPLANGSVAGSNLDVLCYQYKYDHKNRLVEKKLPQKEWEYIVYDKQDRVVMSGPAYSPYGNGTKGWLINKYDALGRLIIKGHYPSSNFNSSNRYTLSQNTFAAESKTGDNTVDGTWIIYSNNNFPTSFTLLNVYYYDEYWFPYAPTSFPVIEGQATNTALKGQLTGTVNIVFTGPSTKNLNVSYNLYDDKYRVIRNFFFNHLGGYTQTDYKLKFSGVPEKTITYQRQNGNSPVITITDNFTYDNSERLLTHTQKINNGTLETIASNVYDELGALKTKNVGGATGNLQNVDFKYNVRGWLTDVNNVELDENDLYNQKIYYNTPKKTGWATGAPISTRLYNGNINYVETKTKNDNILKGYRYQYDDINRLKEADFFEGFLILTSIPKGHFKEHLTYDKNGNILTLDRTGDLLDDLDGMPLPVDNLNYVYNGNQLQSVTDNSSPTVNDGFKDGNKTGDDYAYDSFGNITQDLNKGITAISYNHLNLPFQVTFNNGSTIKYIYDADGNRLSKAVQPSGGSLVTTDYVNGFQYENNVLQFFPHAEGYVKRNTNNTYLYVYQYKDYLGNIRLSYADVNGNGTIQPASEILEENNYYPFGLKHKGYNEVVNINRSEAAEKYKFGGKELNDELGLDLYDFGARNYDAAIGRWLNVDPLAELYRRHTPYAYAVNNPVYFIDPDGMHIDPGSQTEWDRLKASVTQTRNSLQSDINKINQEAIDKGWDAKTLATNMGDKIERLDNINQSLSNMSTLESSTQLYSLNKTTGNAGITTYNQSTDGIEIGYVNDAVFVHEMTHASQFETGDIAFNITGGQSFAQDLDDELAAYKAQAAFDPSSLGGTSVNKVNRSFISNLVDQNGNKVYGANGTSNSGLFNVTINSTVGQLILAYPQSRQALQNLDQKMRLKEFQGIKFKK